MDKSKIGIALILIGVLILFYGGYLLYGASYLQNNLSSLCTIGNFSNSTYQFSCSYGLIQIQGTTPVNSVPVQLLPLSISAINTQSEEILLFGVVILAIGLFLKFGK